MSQRPGPYNLVDQLDSLRQPKVLGIQGLLRLDERVKKQLKSKGVRPGLTQLQIAVRRNRTKLSALRESLRDLLRSQ